MEDKTEHQLTNRVCDALRKSLKREVDKINAETKGKGLKEWSRNNVGK